MKPKFSVGKGGKHQLGVITIDYPEDHPLCLKKNDHGVFYWQMIKGGWMYWWIVNVLFSQSPKTNIGKIHNV